MLLNLLTCISYFLREKSPVFVEIQSGKKMQGLKGLATFSAVLNYVRQKY